MNNDVQTRLLRTLAGDQQSCPLFFPGVYDYKAAFSETPAHLFGQDKADLIAAMESEIAEIQADMVVCAYDIYNLEAEAIGSHVIREPGRFPSIAQEHLPALLGISGPCAWRINLSPQVVAEQTHQEIARDTQRILALAQQYGNVVVGTGILPLNTPLNHIQAIRESITSADPYP